MVFCCGAEPAATIGHESVCGRPSGAPRFDSPSVASCSVIGEPTIPARSAIAAGARPSTSHVQTSS